MIIAENWFGEMLFIGCFDLSLSYLLTRRLETLIKASLFSSSPASKSVATDIFAVDQVLWILLNLIFSNLISLFLRIVERDFLVREDFHFPLSSFILLGVLLLFARRSYWRCNIEISCVILVILNGFFHKFFIIGTLSLRSSPERHSNQKTDLTLGFICLITPVV